MQCNDLLQKSMSCDNAVVVAFGENNHDIYYYWNMSEAESVSRMKKTHLNENS